MTEQEKPKDKLYEMLSERRPNDLDCNTNTNYPSTRVLQVQELDAVLGAPEGFNLPFFAYSHELRASLMWSWEGLSRSQAVEASKNYEAPQGMQIDMNSNRIIDRNGEPKKKGGFLGRIWGRKKDEEE